jgi:ERCC4-related helicase/ERCC4-type nuclease
VERDPETGVHVLHPALKPGTVEFRGYQVNLARLAGKADTLVVLPTGMGKTIVAVLALADALQAGARRILVLAPTRPLVEQHAASLAGLLADPWPARVHALTGTQSPAKRAAAYGAEEGCVVVATPQVVQNDLVGGRLDLSAFDWVVFDEAHRAVGDYPYTFIGEELQRKAPKVRRLGLTASPGHEVRKIDEVRTRLGLAHVEIRTPADPDVAPYVQETEMEWETLPLPPTMARVSAKLQEALAERIRAIKALGLLKDAGSRPSRKDLLRLGGELQARLSGTAQPEPALFSALSLQAQAMKVLHAIEQVETQGAAAFVEYLESMRADAQGPKATKASRSVVEDPRVNEAYHVARFDDAENPKLGRAGTLVQQQLQEAPQSRIIVFTHYRSTCELVATHLAKLPGVRPVLFVGQARKGEQAGLSQKEQKETLERFRRGEHNVLVATSVAEEGLDIPDTDLVVFFEPIPSEIRSIQRRGRTGRQSAGRVVVLMTKGTQDEAAHWSSRRKEAQMVRELQSLRAVVAAREGPRPAARPQETASGPLVAAATPSAITPTGQSTLLEVPTPRTVAAAPLGPGPRIVFDLREQQGAVVRHLHELGAQLEGRQLEVADFVLSDRVAVERKSCADFVDSLVDGRLFEQLRTLRAYPRPFLLLEGDSLHGHRNVSVEAVMGALAAVTVDHGIPVLQVREPLDTARFLMAVAKREQGKEQRKLAVRPAKPAMDDAERQVYLLCGLPGISDTLAARLLDRFGSVAAVLAASVAHLAEVDGVGPQKASEIRRILDLGWRPPRA